MTKTGLAGLVPALLAILLYQHAVTAAKPVPPTPNWPCSITFDGMLSYTNPITLVSATVPTAVQSDSAGPYIDGAQGVQCYVNRGTTSGNFGNMFVNAVQNSPRFLSFPGQTATTPHTRFGYTSFENRQPGYFEITRIDTVSAAGQRRRVRIGTGYELDFDGGLMRGDNDSSDPLIAGSSSAWVTPTSFNVAGQACSWELRFYPSAALEAGDTGAISGTRVLALEEGPPKRRIRSADFAMPFSATVTLKSGANGCP